MPKHKNGSHSRRSITHNTRCIQTAFNRCATVATIAHIDEVVSELDLMLRDGEVRLWRAEKVSQDKKRLRSFVREYAERSGTMKVLNTDYIMQV